MTAIDRRCFVAMGAGALALPRRALAQGVELQLMTAGPGSDSRLQS